MSKRETIRSNLLVLTRERSFERACASGGVTARIDLARPGNHWANVDALIAVGKSMVWMTISKIFRTRRPPVGRR